MTTQQSVEKYTMTARALLDRVGFVLSTTQLFDYFDQMYSNSAKLNAFIFQSAQMHGFRCEYATWSVTLNLADHFVALGCTQRGAREQYFAVEFYGKAADTLGSAWVCDNMEVVQSSLIVRPLMSIPGPKYVLDNPAPTPFQLRVFQQITKRLNDPEWTRDSRCGTTAENSHWDITIPGVATEEDKQVIERELARYGWNSVGMSNSDATQNTPGVFTVRLYAKAIWE